jgi:hypothetical protein
MQEGELIITNQLLQTLEIDVPGKKSFEEIKEIIAGRINYLINHDFEKLVRILYTIDIPEKALKEKLQDQKADAGAVIAAMIIQRQLQKIKTRAQFKTGDDIPEEEKW